MIDLYTVATANGQRASIALEECGLAYRTTLIDLMAGEHRSEHMLDMNPVGRMPFIIDHDFPGGALRVYGSLAVGHYAANRSGLLQPVGERERAEFQTWLGILMTDLAPALASQFAVTVLAPQPLQWAADYFSATAVRLFGLADAELADKPYFLGDRYTLVDVMAYPSVATSLRRLPGGIEPYPNLRRWADRVGRRPAVIRGMDASST